MTLLVTAAGEPIPPADIVRRLERIGESVDTEFRLQWRSVRKVWAIMAKWKPSDRRYGLIREGKIGDYPYDTVATFPEAANADEAFHLFVRGLKRSNRDDISKAMDHLVHWNESVADAHANKAAEPILDDIDSIAGRRLTNTAASFGGFGKGSRGKRLTTIPTGGAA